MAGWLAGCLVAGWPAAGWVAGRVAGWPAGWLAGWVRWRCPPTMAESCSIGDVIRLVTNTHWSQQASAAKDANEEQVSCMLRKIGSGAVLTALTERTTQSSWQVADVSSLLDALGKGDPEILGQVIERIIVLAAGGKIDGGKLVVCFETVERSAPSLPASSLVAAAQVCSHAH